MNIPFRLAFIVCLLHCLSAIAAEPLDPSKGKEEGPLVWYDIRELGIEGQGWKDVKAPYDRLPAKAEGKVRDAVWGLSRTRLGWRCDLRPIRPPCIAAGR